MTHPVHGGGAPENASIIEANRNQDKTFKPNDLGPLRHSEHQGEGSAASGLWADPALVVGLVFAFWRINVGTGHPIPLPLQALFHDHVRRGDPVCRILLRQCVWDGLADPVPTDAALEDGGRADA
ncbi:hypothetical protein N9H93_01290 [Rhizobiaceae bacterium]|nr:hypothetical protein [Rhizobiaceae bacterium]